MPVVPYRASTGARLSDDEHGSGMISTLLGAVMFLAFMLFAVNVLVGLYATSVTAAVATDAVRQATSGGPGSITAADAYARTKLSNLDEVRLEWIEENGQVGLHIMALRPSILPPALLGDSTLTTIDRTVWARSEVER